MVYRKTEKVRLKQKSKEKAIIQAAKEVFAQKGFQDASIKDIVRKAGVATGTFYLYFRNKERFFEALVEEMYQELLQAISEERKKVTGAIAKLRVSMEVCIKLFNQERNLAKIVIIQAPAASPAVGRHVSHVLEALVELTREDLEEAMADGLIPPGDSRVLALAFVGSFNQVIRDWLGSHEPYDLEQAFETLLRFNWRGLGINFESVQKERY